MKEKKLETKAVWGGEEKLFWENATQVPVSLSVSYGFNDVNHWLDVSTEKAPGHIYSRNTNPTVKAFEEKIRIMDGAAAATCFSTGMAAVSGTLYALLSPNDRVVSIKDCYGGTGRMFLEFLPKFGIKVDILDTLDREGMEAALSRPANILYLETPTNPTLKILDIRDLARKGKKAGALVVVDNTFATPVNQSPLSLGADLVIYSATKYLGGHADAMGGVVTGPADIVKKIYQYREITGASLDPTSAYLLLRGMKTLHLRIERQNENALSIARFLEKHPKVESVIYPGLESHPGHETAKKQMSGFGGVLSFSVKGGFEAMSRMLPKLKYASLAANIGSVETIAGPPATTSHVECTPEQRKKLGIPESLVRYSTGIENVEDLKEDLDQALEII